MTVALIGAVDVPIAVCVCTYVRMYVLYISRLVPRIADFFVDGWDVYACHAQSHANASYGEACGINAPHDSDMHMNTHICINWREGFGFLSWLHVCVGVYTCTCIHATTLIQQAIAPRHDVYVHTQHVCNHTHVCLRTHIHTCTHKCIHTCTQHIFTNVVQEIEGVLEQTCTRTCIHACTQT